MLKTLCYSKVSLIVELNSQTDKDFTGLPVVCENNGMIEMYGVQTMEPSAMCGHGQYENGYENLASGDPRKFFNFSS